MKFCEMFLIAFVLATFMVLSLVSSIGAQSVALVSANSVATYPLLAMPEEYVDYTISRVNGSLWAKIDGTYPLYKLFGAGDVFKLGDVEYTVLSDDLPMVYPTPPGTTNIIVRMNETELSWSNFTETYPEALHHTAIGDWPMIYCEINNASDYFTLKIHYEHPVAIINGSYTFLYDLNISPYLTPWSNKSTAYFNIRMEAPYANLHMSTTASNEAWTPANYSTTRDDTSETITLKIVSEYSKQLLGDLIVSFTDPTPGFLGTGLPLEHGYGIVALVAVAIVTVFLVYFRKAKKAAVKAEKTKPEVVV